MRFRAQSLPRPSVALLVLAGCASPTIGASPPPAPPQASAEAVPVRASRTVDDASSPPGGPVAKQPPPNKGTPDDDDSPTVLPIRYAPTTTDVEIYLDGVNFLVTASAVQVGGGWGVRVKAKVWAARGKSYRLLTPERGPFGFGGTVVRGGQTRVLEDKRQGDDITAITDQPIEFSRDWPGDSGEKPLRQGDKLELLAELWGISAKTYTTMVPMKRFFAVQAVVGKGKPEFAVGQPKPTE